MDTYARNRATSYGLTLVAGRPLPPDLTAAVLQLQHDVEQEVPGWFEWYAAGSLHVTLAAPLRGRYRAAPPLRRSELPAGLSEFFDGLILTCAALPPLELSAAGAHLTHRSLLVDIEGGKEHKARLRELIGRTPGWDAPKGSLGRLHLSAGYLVPGVDEARAGAQVARVAGTLPVASAMVDEIALVHYANRTLASIVGEVRLPLGGARTGSEPSFLAALQIAG